MVVGGDVTLIKNGAAAPSKRAGRATKIGQCVRIRALSPGGASYPKAPDNLPETRPRTVEVTDAAPSVSVVIPALNEAENLRSVLRDLPLEYEVVVVDGHSTDGTVRVARAVRQDASIVQQTGLGKGDALAEGFDLATGDVIVTLDADCSAAASEIPRFVEALSSGADFAKGSRYLVGGGSDDLTHLRSFGNRALTRLVNLLYGTHYTDLCYGYNAFWRKLVPLLHVERTGFEVETLIALRVAKAGLVVTEVPSYERSRGAGVGKLHTFRDGWRVLGAILRERWSLGVRTQGDGRVAIRAASAVARMHERPATDSPLPGSREGAVLPGRPRLPARASTARARVGVIRAGPSGRGPRARAGAGTKQGSRQ